MSFVVRNRIGLLLLLLLVVGWVAGCTSSPVPAATSTSASDSPSGEVAPSASESVVLTLPGEDWGYPSPFAFYSRGPGYIRMSFLFDTLTWKDENGVIPWLADSWDTSEGGTAWTFTLHPGIAWHDGTPLTAEDVAFTFEYFKEHQASFTWSWSVDKVARTEVVDEYTVTLYLTEPIAGCHESLVGSLPIIPRHIWEGVDDPVKFLAEEAIVGSERVVVGAGHQGNQCLVRRGQTHFRNG